MPGFTCFCPSPLEEKRLWQNPLYFFPCGTFYISPLNTDYVN